MAVKIIVDGKVIETTPDQNLLGACLSAGLDVPYFCWHPAMGSVGSCRQCAVKIFRGPADSTGQIVMACMTRLTPGMRVSVADAQAAKFREAVVETVLTNHPHDCPVCEVGGECHLQDMTALTGHAARRTRAPKRTHVSQNLGPFIRHEMNRCIGCYRCVRFYKDYAGGEDFGVFGAARNVYFGRAEDGALESMFAGNLTEVCPTGVFVDKPFSARFRRKWDMRATPSVCLHCAVGCNITVQERGGVFRRVVNRFNATLNGHFLCDRGRFGAGFVAGPARLPAAPGHVAALAAVLRRDGLIGIGSPRASVEANFALRELVGAENFYAGLTPGEAAAVAILRAVPVATMRDAEDSDAVLVLGDDPAVVAPRLALALRQAATRVPAAVLAALDIPAWDDGAARAAAAEKTPFIVASAAPGWLDKLATQVVREDIIGFAAGVAGDPGHALFQARRPVVVAGGDAAMMFAGANIVIALRRAGVDAKLCLLLPAANSLGLALLDARGLSEAPVKGRDVLVLERDVVLWQAKSRTVLDCVETAATRNAELALGVASFAEADGTFVNMEGRAQRFYKANFGPEDPPPSWALLRDAGVESGRLAPGRWETHRALLAELRGELAGCAAASPAMGGARPATLPFRYSGRTVGPDVREKLPPQHPDSPLGTTMEGPPIHAQHGVVPVLWAPGWNSGQVVNKAEPAAEDVFLFDVHEAAPALFEVPAPTDNWQLTTDDLFELSPAIIARREAGAW
jgi:NADH-quinone oxidoreductase subunit G